MTGEERKRRLESAEAEIAEFCRVFGMKARWERAHSICARDELFYERALSLVIFRKSRRNGRDDIVFEMKPCATHDSNVWTPKWRTAEKTLTALKRDRN